MMNSMSSDLRKFQKKLIKMQEQQEAFCKACAKELAARLLAKVIKRTPVAEYDKPVSFTTASGKEVSFKPNTGKKGGTLRRGWTARTQEEAESGGKTNATSYVDSMTVERTGDIYTITILNPVDYASYVEFGHRTKNHKGWVPGQFMLTISEQEIEQIAPKVLEKKLEKFLADSLK